MERSEIPASGVAENYATLYPDRVKAHRIIQASGIA